MREVARDVALRFSTGDGAVDGALVEVIPRLTQHLDACDIGFYLHGSALAGARRSTSDVDVLGLGNGLVTRIENQTAKAVAAEVSSRTGIELDLKVFSAEAFSKDPWVNLWEGAAILAGRDWRTELPKPSVDDLAREAVLHACLIIRARGDAAEEPLGEVKPKTIAWLVSALLAVRHGYAPPGRSAAADALKQHEPRWAAKLGPNLAPTEVAVAAQFLDEVLEALKADLGAASPVLGTRCHAVVSQYVLDL